MPVLPILQWPDPCLARVAVPAVPDAKTAALATDMLGTMYDARGRGLAAPQVGVSQRMFVMDVCWKDGTPAPLVVLNPEILAWSAAEAIGPEGCLSIPGVVAMVQRPTSVSLRWTGLDGVVQQAVLTGFAAICAQHEIDHLDGIVTLQRDPQAAASQAAASLAVASLAVASLAAASQAAV